MIEHQGLPEGLVGMAPGPGLAAVLATIDRSRLSGSEVFDLLKARARQVAHDQAQLLADLLEAGHTPFNADADGVCRADRLDEFSADEPAFALRWSRQAAQGQLRLAADLTGRLAVVFAALSAGRIDLARAWVFSSALSCLDDVTATALAERFVGKAEDLTPGKLRERLHYHALKADPAAAKRRYQDGVADRRVYAQLHGDGTAELAGVNLAPDRAAAAYDRVDRLARAAKAGGDPRGLNQLRADAYLDLLTGIAFATRPSTDPLTQAADTAAAAHGIGLDDPAAGSGRDGEPPVPARVGVGGRPGDPRRGERRTQVRGGR